MDPKETLRKGATGPVPKSAPAALAWLYRMYAALTALFTKDLPELEDFPAPRPEDKPVFSVVAWTRSHHYARAEIAALWQHRRIARDSIRVHVATLRDPDRTIVLDSIQSEDAGDVDAMITSMATRLPGACLTLVGPGVALRLNRKARRAAGARTRRVARRGRRTFMSEHRREGLEAEAGRRAVRRKGAVPAAC